MALCVATHCVELCGVTFADGLAFLWFAARALSKLACFQPTTFQKMFQTNHFSISKGYFPIFAHICQKCHVSNQPLTLSYFQMVFLDVETNLKTKCSLSRMCERSRPTDRPPSQSSHVSSGEPYKKWQTLGKIPTFAVFCFVLILVFYLRGTLWQRQKRGVWLFVKFIGSALV